MLSSRAVLVAETEFIIALGIQAVLEGLGAGDVVMANSAGEAHSLLAGRAPVALALIEVETHKPELVALARHLLDGGIPVLGLSADVRLASGMPDLPGTPIIIKPVPDEELTRAIERLTQKPLPDVT